MTKCKAKDSRAEMSTDSEKKDLRSLIVQTWCKQIQLLLEREYNTIHIKNGILRVGKLDLNGRKLELKAYSCERHIEPIVNYAIREKYPDLNINSTEVSRAKFVVARNFENLFEGLDIIDFSGERTSKDFLAGSTDRFFKIIRYLLNDKIKEINLDWLHRALVITDDILDTVKFGDRETYISISKAVHHLNRFPGGECREFLRTYVDLFFNTNFESLEELKKVITKRISKLKERLAEKTHEGKVFVNDFIYEGKLQDFLMKAIKLNIPSIFRKKYLDESNFIANTIISLMKSYKEPAPIGFTQSVLLNHFKASSRLISFETRESFYSHTRKIHTLLGVVCNKELFDKKQLYCGHDLLWLAVAMVDRNISRMIAKEIQLATSAPRGSQELLQEALALASSIVASTEAGAASGGGSSMNTGHDRRVRPCPSAERSAGLASSFALGDELAGSDEPQAGRKKPLTEIYRNGASIKSSASQRRRIDTDLVRSSSAGAFGFASARCERSERAADASSFLAKIGREESLSALGRGR